MLRGSWDVRQTSDVECEGRVRMQSSLTGRFYRALVYVAAAHANQCRQGTKVPYVAHLLMAAGLVLDHGGNENEAIAALLHDTVAYQGGERRLRDIQQQFGDEVAAIVRACSDIDRDPEPWRQRTVHYLEHLHGISPAAQLVSAADALANVTSMISDYRIVNEVFWNRVSVSKADQLWYYRALTDILARRVPLSLARELDSRVRELEVMASHPHNETNEGR
jgi:(p)ppGpp synthase/HD superfamily hydrolase